MNSFLGAFAPINCTVANYFLGTMLLFTTEATTGRYCFRVVGREAHQGPEAVVRPRTTRLKLTYFVCMKSSRRATFAGITENSGAFQPALPRVPQCNLMPGIRCILRFRV